MQLKWFVGFEASKPYVYLKIYTKVHSLFSCLLYCVKGKQNKVCIKGSISGKRMTQKRRGSMQPFKNSHLSTSSNNCKVRSQMKKVRIFIKLYELKENATANVTILWKWLNQTNKNFLLDCSNAEKKSKTT